MSSFFAELDERGFLSQQTHDDLSQRFTNRQVVGYVGFDPTADSLQAGNLVPIMALAHLQRHGGKPIVIIGGATALIGDPSGKLEARPILSEEQIERNLTAQKEQLRKFLHFGEGATGAVMLNNAEWFRKKQYIDFLREIGNCFSVNRMVKMESVVNRMEKGISYLEFNYMILQAYDYLVLFDRYGCRLQLGGDDQWGNIVMGMELIRRLRREEACGITFPLITTSSGQKMGKTERGTVWLDARKTSPYEFYQYWINVEDQLVPRCLNFYTFLPKKERDELSQLRGSDIRSAKQVLAYSLTELVHGTSEADAAREGSESVFSGPGREKSGIDFAAIPSTSVPEAELKKGMAVLPLIVASGLARSNNQARKLLQGGGFYINEERFQDPEKPVTIDHIGDEGFILLRKGKKNYHRIIVE